MRFEISHVNRRYRFEISHYGGRGNKDLAKLCNPPLRGHLANLFLWEVRRGVKTPALVVSGVRLDLMYKIDLYIRLGNGFQSNRKREYLRPLDRYPKETFDFARWAVWYESSRVLR